MEEISIKPENKQDSGNKRPFVLTMLCLFSFVFFGLIAVIYLVALFFSGSLYDMTLRYAPENSPGRFSILLYIIGGFILHASGVAGTLFIWKMRKLGYLLFGTSALLVSAYQLFATQISPLTTFFYIVQILAFGFFVKKLH